MDEPTYSESARGVLITRTRAERELMNHGVTLASDIDECFATIPAHSDNCGTPFAAPMYDAGDVLDWLGY